MTRNLNLLLALIASSGFISDSSAASCYTRDGKPVTDDTYQPCNTRDRNVASMCCALRHEENNHTGIANDACDPNGLCQNWAVDDGTGHPPMMWWRDFCTDPNWRSPFCLKDVCASSQLENGDNTAIMENCGNGTWCCAQNDKNCCQTKANVFALAATVGVTSTSSSTSASATSSSSSAFTTTPTTPTGPGVTNVPSNNSSSGISSSAKLGIGLGVALGVVAVAQPSEIYGDVSRNGKDAPMYGQPTYAQYGPPVELEDRPQPPEAGGTPRAELQGSSAELPGKTPSTSSEKEPTKPAER